MYKRKNIFGIILGFLFSLTVASGVFAAAFNANDLVVLRAGDGSGALSSAATAVFLDEYSAATGSLVQTISLPTVTSGSNRPLTVSGNSTAEGSLRRSADHHYLTLTGYSVVPGVAGIVSTASATTNRVIGRVDVNGTIDTTTTISNFFSAGNIRGAVTDDGTRFWTVGNKDGVQYVTYGSSTSTQINSAAPTNLRVPGIFNGQLYISAASGAFQGVGTVGTDLPLVSGQTPTLLPGFPTASGPSSYGFYISNANTVYVADDRVLPNGGIQKWIYSSGTGSWTLDKTMNNGIATGVRGLTGYVSGPNVVLFATTTESSSNKLVTVTDDGTATPAFTVLATAATNEAFRGVDLAPLAVTATLTTATAGSGSGSISGVANPYTLASTATITAIPDAGSTFTGWSGCSTSVNPGITVTMDSDKSCTANFTALAVIDGACGTDDGKTLAAHAPTSLCAAGTASAVSGGGHPWAWTCASPNGGSTASCAATIQTYTVTFATNGTGTLSGTTTQTIDYGGSTTAVTAQPGSNFDFVNWTGTNGFVATTTNPLTLTNVAGNYTITANFTGTFTITILHVNDTHARITPHKWMIPKHGTDQPVFENVGGAAYLASEMLELTSAKPDSIVIDAGDISEGNPIGDMGGNGTMTQFYTLLSGKLKNQRGRGIDAVVVGNHDVRDINYINNLVALQNSGTPVISVNVRDVNTHQPYFAPYTIVTINGVKIGILGYTTQASEVGASLANTLEVANCDWSSADATKIHLADYVNELRINQGCSVVILAAHIGHSAIVDPTAPLLVDNGAAKLPEVVVSGHWHTWTDTVWQPSMLNYKTIFTESASYMKYIGELQVTSTGKYVSSVQHVIRDADLTPDPDAQALIDTLIDQYNTAHPGHPVDEVIGYTADNLMLDNNMKWWSADEYPWSGNNTAGQWICDAMRWKAEQLFTQCDLSIEAGGGVRADIPAGPVSYLQIYETFPWNDDTLNRVNMTGQEIVNFLKATNMDAGFSSALDVTASEGVPMSVKFNGQPIDLNHIYTVAINNYMYAHPPSGWTWSDKSPLTSPVLCRDGIVDYMRQFTADSPYHVGGERYHLDTEFSGGYRAVVTMMNDNDTKPVYEYAFIRFLNALPETAARRGSKQVPADLVNVDGTINPANRLSEQELYRSYLGFKTGALKPGDIIETWGKGSFYGGNPEFVDQEGIYADGVEFKIVGHDESLAGAVVAPSIGAFWNDNYKNHYVQFVAKKAGTSTVSDQYGQTITVFDATGYAAKTLPGNVGDMLLITGVPTMESYALRFRCDSAAATSESFPLTAFTISSIVDALSGTTATSPVTLSATVSTSSATWYFSPAADAYVASGKPTTNYGASTNMYVQSSISSYGNERAWLKFDLSGIPAGSTIKNAALQLWDWKATGAALPVEVRGGSDDSWTETGMNWNNQPAFDLPIATQSLAAGSANLWYTWDVTPFAQTKWNANKLMSLVVKAVTEGAADATAPSYAFDSKEYGSNVPVLQVVAQDTPVQIQYFYRYSADGVTWGAWTPAGTVVSAPWTVSFAYPEGPGHYEFYSVASDNFGNVQAAPVSAQASIVFAPAVNAACGSSNGGSFTSVPATNLCATGLASSVTGSGPWAWNCGGLNSGTDAACSATKTAVVAVPTGDLNGDGSVDVADALKALRIASGLETPTAAILTNGDVAPLVNGKPAPDGKIDIGDVVVILRKAVGLVSW